MVADPKDLIENVLSLFVS